MGNLSYEIDDETIIEFFKPAGTLTGLRWLTHKDSGDFRVGDMSVICSNSDCNLYRAVVLWNLAVLKKRIRL